ncbi:MULTISPECIES: ABC transporter substrate-binding protein [unclassified Rhodococcus (in: high G+C Gram-positive bacteria)]|uniref:ABC transporter substrate-binding protein n=1 Tax=unclassified Rhodococcus (in: high G+C Gram-positive bacteria) TaxID=192944 RepID=UPI001B34CE4D|nr:MULTISPECIES: ABC transporter substrate-binding protein [unclassified Rhodococcus (in: high G+C Gram-positive bacteria)]MCZ4080002.1 ABC transporter substrate-binding protein [Rhodococcus sp. H36-A4]MDJ0362413.1 ABC transporter substrate-binding protein [Rhodococcus sp. H29-C3]
MRSAKIGSRVAVGLAALLALSACGVGGDPSKTLTVTMWGGAGQQTHIESYVTPWAKANGLKVRQDSPSDYAKIAAQVDNGNVKWGVVEVEPNYAETACANGTLTPLSEEVKAAAVAANIDPKFMSDCGIPVLLYAFTIAYNTDTFPDAHPTTWAQFFDTDTFPGKRGFWNYATGGMFEAALLADGVEPENLYPLDLDRAFRKLDTIKDDIVFYDTGDEQAQLVASGEAPLVQAWNGRVGQAAAEDQPIANEWGENLISHDQVVIPKGYPNTELAMDWMVHFLGDVEGQARDAEGSLFAPVNPAALDEVPSDIAKELSTYPANIEESAGAIDYRYWAEHYNEVTERLNAWAIS